MENLDLTVLRTLHGWRAQGQRALLATVVRTLGSSPRPVGSIMALCESGAVAGSVSGGSIEEDLIYRNSRSHQASAAVPVAGITYDIPDSTPQRVKYDVSADEAHRFGLPCGGTLELVLEFNLDAASLLTLVQSLADIHMVQRRTRIAEGQVELIEVNAPSSLIDDGDVLVNTFGPEYRMLLIGASQLTEYLAP